MRQEESDFEKEKIERLQRAMYSRTLSEKMQDKPRHAFETGEPDVAEDFRSAEPQMPRAIVAPRVIGVTRKFLWVLLGLAVVFFLVAVGFFAYFFLFGGGSVNASASNIDNSTSGPPQVQSGEATELQVIVDNRNSTSLELAEIVVTFPPGTRSPTDYTSDYTSFRHSLGTIEAGGRRQGTVKAVFSGVQGEQADIQVELDYHIPGSNAIFIASSKYTITYASAPISLSVDGNSETISGQPVQFTVNVSSNATAPIADVLVSAQYPFGFKQTSSDPVQTSDGLWAIGTLAPGQQKSIKIRGVLTGEQGDSRIFKFVTGTRSNPSASAITTPLSDRSLTLSVAKPFLGLDVAINGVSGQTVTVSPDDSVTVTVGWENNLESPISNASIVARITGLQIDGTLVHPNNGFYRSSDGIVLWDKTTDPSLASLAPGARGTETFSFKMPSSEVLKNVLNPQLSISINAAGSRASETGVPQTLQATASQKVAVASDLQLAATGLYYSNPFGSSGPLPPKAESETTYAVVFTVTNTTNKISNATLTATLPPYVRWLGVCSPSNECDPAQNKLTLDPQNSTLTWHLGDVEPGVGLRGTPPRQMAVSIGLTPSTSQIGQKPTLLQNITFTGTDTATNAGITKYAPDVTTNITSDPGFSTANAEVVK